MKVNRNVLLIAFIGCLLFLPAAGNAQYAVSNGVFSNGAALSTDSSAFNLHSISGQVLIDQASNNSYFVYSGFLYTGGSIVTGLDDLFADLPQTFELYQNFPNPFNPATTIKWALPNSAVVKIDVYNLLGQHMATLLDESRPAGIHLVNFNAGHFSSGVYFYTIQAADFWKVKKMMLLK